MTAATDRLLAELDELTRIRDAGLAASAKARPVVVRALKAGVPVADLIGRPFSRAEVNKIKSEAGLTRPRTPRGQ